jgi:hypothetical protein
MTAPKIRLVLGDKETWSVGRITRGWAAHMPNCTVGKSVDPTADANVYCPYGQLRVKGPSLDVSWFTHRRDDKAHQARWELSATLADLCIAMSKNQLPYLPLGKTRIIRPGIDEQFFVPGPVKFLVAVKEAEQNRKRLDWLSSLRIPNTEWRLTNGKIKQEDMPSLYRWADYVVVLSRNEGGPLCINEAMASKKPIIAPNCGYCWDWPVIRYTTFPELRGIVSKLARGNMPSMEGYGEMAKALLEAIQDHLTVRRATPWPQLYIATR